MLARKRSFMRAYEGKLASMPVVADFKRTKIDFLLSFVLLSLLVLSFVRPDLQ